MHFSEDMYSTLNGVNPKSPHKSHGRTDGLSRLNGLLWPTYTWTVDADLSSASSLDSVACTWRTMWRRSWSRTADGTWSGRRASGVLLLSFCLQAKSLKSRRDQNSTNGLSKNRYHFGLTRYFGHAYGEKKSYRTPGMSRSFLRCRQCFRLGCSLRWYTDPSREPEETN